MFSDEKKDKKENSLKVKYNKVILLILDGFGVNPNLIESPWKFAKHPNFENIEKFYPFTVLQASGMAVGLPFKEEGNSEVGHLTIGAGRIVYSALPRISLAIEDKKFFNNTVFLKTIKKIKESGYKSRLHLIGLFSSGSVHASADHLYALLNFALDNNIPNVYLHLFTDGRDASPYEGADFIESLEKKLDKTYKNAKIASIIGRDFAMERDEHWEKIEKTYNLYAKGEGEKFKKASDYLNECYKKNIQDEFIPPGIHADDSGNIPGIIKNGDAVIFFNFREDSMREISSAFLKNNFNKFKKADLKDVLFVTMTKYDKNAAHAAFPPLIIQNPLAKVLSDNGKKQIHIAETEKYAHVTYFFNGGKEESFKGEDRILIPSLRDANFEEAPEMSAFKITETIIDSISKYDFIIANFANADMVGHTGNFNATVKAFEILDTCAGKIIKEAEKENVALIITGDHGNAEEKIYELSGEKKTKHSINPVPFYFVANDFKSENPVSPDKIKEKYQKISGSLMDITTTILEIMDIKKPDEMTGISLIQKFLN